MSPTIAEDLGLDTQPNFNKAIDVARFQSTVMKAMVRIRSQEFSVPKDNVGLDSFCSHVNEPNAWHLAQTVTPEFRDAKVRTEGTKPVNNENPALAYVLSKLNHLRTPSTDQHVLTSEQVLLSQRHKLWVEYTVTGGYGKEAASTELRDEISQRLTDIESMGCKST